MPLSILTNVAALRSQRRLAATSNDLQRTYERLSSGQRINRASDDPAGLAVSSKLRSASKLTTVAMRNVNDGMSLLNVGDAALGEIGNILNRMAEIAAQSANGIYSNLQRNPLQAEFLALGSEIERISATTQFNGLNVLSGLGQLTLQVGIDGTANSRISLQGVNGTLSSMALANSGSSSLSYSVIAATALESQAAARTALDAVYAAIQDVSTKRGLLGAAESRLSSTISNLASARQNFEAAASRIEDVDTAEEITKLVRLQILQNAQASILAQANLQPQLVLKLLDNK